LPEDHPLVRDREPGNRMWSHAWLDRDGLAIDITADQFGDARRRVIVEYGSAWHRTLRGEKNGVADFANYDPTTSAALGADYSTIVSRL
jgi:hypothetical protein